MFKLLKKITAIGILSLFTVLSFSLTTSADNNIYSPLDDIKTKLEEDGIHVVDQSEQKAWGSLGVEDIEVIKNIGPKSLKELTNEHSTDFEELNDFKKELNDLISKKSQTNDKEKIKLISDNIKGVENSVQDKTDEIKENIKTLIEGSYTDEDILNKKVNLFFNEINIYLRSDKWRELSSGVVLKLTDYGYINLNQVKEIGTIAKIKEELNKNENLSENEIDEIVGEVLSLNYKGENQINSIVKSIVNIIKNLIGGIAIILIIINAMQMIFAGGDETIIKEKKQGIMYAVIGLIIILVLDQIIKFIYGTPIVSIGGGGLMDMRNEGFSDEVYGMVSFIKAIVGSIAVLMIVISGVRILTAQGEEDEIKKQKTSILWVGVGIIIILINKIIVDNIFIAPVENSDQISGGNVLNIITLLGDITKFGLGFVGIVALGFLIYGAVLMIANYGNEEGVDKSKKIIKNALIGIVIIISAYTIINTIISFG